MPNLRNSAKQSQVAHDPGTASFHSTSGHLSDSDKNHNQVLAVPPSPDRRKARPTPAALAGRIPRPCNAFMLYRSSLLGSGVLAVEARQHQNRVSETAASMWNALSESDKRPWHERAKIARQEHAKKYPEYWMTRKEPRNRSTKRLNPRASMPKGLNSDALTSKEPDPVLCMFTEKELFGKYERPSPSSLSPAASASPVESVSSNDSFESEGTEILPTLIASNFASVVPSPFIRSSAFRHPTSSLQSDPFLGSIIMNKSDHETLAPLQLFPYEMCSWRTAFDAVSLDERPAVPGDGVDQPWQWAAGILEQDVSL